jgi:hypothetical protein
MKGTKFYSIVKLKCPRCQEGNLFLVSNAWDLKKILDMPNRCPICHQDFRIEPGFYSGALWVSYPIVVIFTVILLYPLFIYPEFFVLDLSIMALVLIGLQPIIMRWGRAIWINIFVHYAVNKNKNERTP